MLPTCGFLLSEENAANAITFFKYGKIQFSRFICLFCSWVVRFSMHPKYLPILFHVFVGMHVYTCTCIVCKLNFFSITFFLCWMLCITCLISFTLLDLTELLSVYHCCFCIAFFTLIYEECTSDREYIYLLKNLQIWETVPNSKQNFKTFRHYSIFLRELYFLKYPEFIMWKCSTVSLEWVFEV